MRLDPHIKQFVSNCSKAFIVLDMSNDAFKGVSSLASHGASYIYLRYKYLVR